MSALEPLITTRSLRELLSDPKLLAPPDPVVAPFLYAGRVTLLSAREKMGKTTLAANAAAALTRGSAFLSEPLARSRVLWFSLDEGLGDTVRRFQALGADPDLLVISTERPNAAQLAALLEASYFRLLVLDTLNELAMGRSLNEPREILPVLRPIVDLIHDSDTACLILGHAGKASGGYLGSVTIGGAVDAPLTLKRVVTQQQADAKAMHDPSAEIEDDDAPDDGRRILTGLTRWSGRMRVRLAFDGQRYALGDAPLPLRHRLLVALAEGENSATQLSDDLGKRKDVVLKELDELHRQGFVAKGAKSTRITASGLEHLRQAGTDAGTDALEAAESGEPAGNRRGPTPEPMPEPMDGHSGAIGSRTHAPRVARTGTDHLDAA